MWLVPGYSGPVSDHFDGERFLNLAPVEDKGFFDVMDAFLFEDGNARGPGDRSPERPA